MFVIASYLSEAKEITKGGNTMLYGDTLALYVYALGDKYKAGKITQEQFFKYAEKLSQWEYLAEERGVK